MKKKTTKKKSMMEEYFDTAEEFITKFGEKSILLWQCGSFYECYSLGEKGTDYNILEENKFQIESFRDICCMTVVAKGSQTLRNKQVFMAGFTTANPILLEKHINELMKEGFTVKVIIENGDDIVNKLIISVAENKHKKPFFDMSERIIMIRSCI